MSLFFTGSLVFYSLAMIKLNEYERIIGWPTFVLSIILATQMWGILLKEVNIISFKDKLYRFFSILLLITAIIILSYKT